jgi:cobalamin biosynthesis Mg chelatase CobN
MKNWVEYVIESTDSERTEYQSLLSKARQKEIKIVWSDKYKKGMKAQGPKNYIKWNLDVLRRALGGDKTPESINLWRE